MFTYEKGNFRIRPARLQDICDLSPKLRQLDLDEVKASHGHTGEQALLAGYVSASHCFTVELSGEVIAMFGVSPSVVGPRIGSGWLLGSDKIDSSKIAFAKASLKALGFLLESYDAVFNFVDARHVRSIEWLKWLGAFFYDERPFGVEQKPFQMFVIDKEDLCANQ
jgi:hypothetical protein